MEQPKPLTPEEIEINQAKYLAWQKAALTDKLKHFSHFEILYTVIYQDFDEEGSEIFGGYFNSFEDANLYPQKWALDEWGMEMDSVITPSIYLKESECIEVVVEKRVFYKIN